MTPLAGYHISPQRATAHSLGNTTLFRNLCPATKDTRMHLLNHGVQHLFGMRNVWASPLLHCLSGIRNGHLLLMDHTFSEIDLAKLWGVK